MSGQYEIWLTDDGGVRLALLDTISYLSYTRAVNQFGALEFAIPFQPFSKRFNPWFRPDWHVEVWRRPAPQFPLRREDVYMLRKPQVYTRSEDNVQMLRFYGRNGRDLLRRRHVIQKAGTSYTTKTNYADDMMKEIVREQMLYGSVVDQNGTLDNSRAFPQGEFSVQGNASLGPQLTLNFEGQNVLELLQKIKEATYQKNVDNPANLRVFYDVVPVSLSGVHPVGWMFLTRAGFYGADRTLQTEFSLENENIKAPSYAISHLDEVNAVYVQGNGRGETQITELVTDAVRISASRWNRCEGLVSASSETDTSGLQNRGASQLENDKPHEDLPLEFLNNPGSKGVPRSLYGLDWDLGDRLRVSYAGKQFEADVNLVYVSVNENGQENITGRNEVNSA